MLFTHHFRRKMMRILGSDIPPSATIARLERSFDIKKTLKKVQGHKYSPYDLQYLLLFGVACFVFFIVESPGVWVKLMLMTLFALALLIPVTSQFFFPCIPIFTWVILFFSCRYDIILWI